MPARFSLASLVVAGAISQSFIFAVLPPAGPTLGLGDVETGLIVSLPTLFAVLFAPLIGLLIDRVGSRRVILAALLIGVVSAIGAGLAVAARLNDALSATSLFALLTMLRATGTSAAVSGMMAAQAYIALTTSPVERSGGMALLGLGQGTGSVLGPLVAWPVATAFGVAASFFAIALPLAVAFAITMICLQPHAPVHTPQLTRVPGRSDLGPALLLGFAALLALSLLQQTAALRLRDGFGLAPDVVLQWTGMILAALAAGTLGAQLFLIRYPLKPYQALFISGVVGASAAIGILLAGSTAPILMLVVPLGISIGLAVPSAMVLASASAGPNRQGQAAAAMAAVQGLGLAIGPSAGVMLHNLSPRAPAILLALVFAAVTLTAAARR